MTTNEDAARAYLTSRRETLDQEIRRLEGRRTEIDYLLAELVMPAPRYTNGAEAKIAAARPGRPAGIGNGSGVTQLELVRQALIAAGDAGLTGREGVVATGLKPNKVSAMLSTMKASGAAIHETPRYYAAASQS